MIRPLKHLAVLHGGVAEFFTYDEDEVQFWRVTFFRGDRKATLRLRIPHAVLRRNSLGSVAACVQGQRRPMALLSRLYEMALEGGLPIVLDGFDEPPKCDKNI